MALRNVICRVVLLAGVVTATRLRHRRNSFLAKEETQSQSMEVMYPFYHPGTKIQSELADLAGRCPGMSMRTVTKTDEKGESRSIDVVNVRAPNSEPKNRNFLLFGEHARELISPESGLHFVKSLCGETDLKDRAQKVLQDNEFEIVINGNPNSRNKVEQGDFCLRVNPNGVDLNRNWDEKWQANTVLDSVDTNPGAQPFSEPETQVFKELVEDFRPNTFLTIHSGTKGMYMPWAYDMEHLAKRNEPQMMQILKSLDKDHCQCPYGAAGKEVGYSCPGTCLDWVYDQMKADYAFAFEIYTSPDYDDMLKDRWQEKMQSGDGAFYQMNSHLGHEHFKDLFEAHPTDFVQLSSAHHSSMSPSECFSQFNPETEEEYKKTVENWSATYLDMAEKVANNLKAGGSKAPVSNATDLPEDSQNVEVSGDA
jgi:hypothetical protein